MFPLITPSEGSGCPLEQELGEALVWGCAFLCMCVPVHEQVHICVVPAWMRFGCGNAGPEWGSGGRLDGTGIVRAHVEGTGSLGAGYVFNPRFPRDSSQCEVFLSDFFIIGLTW